MKEMALLLILLTTKIKQIWRKKLFQYFYRRVVVVKFYKLEKISYFCLNILVTDIASSWAFFIWTLDGSDRRRSRARFSGRRGLQYRLEPVSPSQDFPWQGPVRAIPVKPVLVGWSCSLLEDATSFGAVNSAFIRQDSTCFNQVTHQVSNASFGENLDSN